MIRDMTSEDLKELIESLRTCRQPIPVGDDQIIIELAERAHIRDVLRGDIVIRQGEETNDLYFVMSGQLRAADTSGDEPILLNYHAARAFVGEQSPLTGLPRAATVDAISDSRLAVWDQASFDWLLEQDDRMRSYFKDLYQHRETRARRRPFPGKQWDEVTVSRTGKHPLTLIGSMLLPLVFLIFGLSLGALLLVIGASRTLVTVAAGVPAAFAVLLGVLNYIDWRNDEYIITSKRAIHIERYLLRGRERDEAPLVRIQDVTIATGGLLQRVLDYHDLTIQTAGAGTIKFSGLRDAREVRDNIFEERTKAVERREASDQATIRQTLARRMGASTPEVSIPEETLGLTTDTSDEGMVPWFPGLLDYLVPRTRVVEGDTITWRKHWIIWLQKTWWTLLAMLVLLGLTIMAVLFLPDQVGTARPAIIVVLFLSTLIAFVLYLYQHDGWRRDAYIVTKNRIIDVEGTAFRLGGEERREGSFDAVQNITYDIPGFFENLVNMGSVTIETAGTAATFTFDDVLNPSAVQQEIVNRMVAFQEMRRREEQEQQASMMGQWFGEYHDLQKPESAGS